MEHRRRHFSFPSRGLGHCFVYYVFIRGLICAPLSCLIFILTALHVLAVHHTHHTGSYTHDTHIFAGTLATRNALAHLRAYFLPVSCVLVYAGAYLYAVHARMYSRWRHRRRTTSCARSCRHLFAHRHLRLQNTHNQHPSAALVAVII